MQNPKKYSIWELEPTLEQYKTEYIVDAKVLAQCRNQRQWMPATVIRKHENGLFDIMFNDGKKESNVSENMLKHLRKNPSSNI